MNRLISIFLAVFVSACTTVQFPQPSQVAGIWERVELGYSRLELNEDADGNLIFASNQDEPEIYRIDSFQSEQDGFYFKVHQVFPSIEESLTMNGTLYQEEILCLRELGDEADSLELCFMKSDAIENSKIHALKILESLNSEKQYQIRGSAEHSTDKNTSKSTE